jgi:ADP-dependent phosphofructokinase/glucokinase
MKTGHWEELYRNIQKPRLRDSITGFNMNLDQIIPVTRELLDAPFFRQGNLSELREWLVGSMQYCTAEERFVSDIEKYQQFVDSFSRFGSLAVGGQAGIAALHLSHLGVNRIVCAAPAHGRQSADILMNQGIIVPDLLRSGHESRDLVHLVFEYAPGLVPLAEGSIPRNNRFILSPVHDASSVLIPDQCMDSFLSAAATCSRAFLSGYQYLRSRNDYSVAAAQIARIRALNSDMRVHIEWVSVTDPAVLEGCVQHILPCADSLGLNENELMILAGEKGIDSRPDSPGKPGQITPTQIIESAVALFRHLHLKRLHVHTFGYYVLVRCNDCGDPVASRNALMYAARETAAAARGTKTILLPKGMDALCMAEDLLGPSDGPGIFSAEDCTLVIVPALIAQNISRTTGLGDILSSTAVAADEF